MTIQTAKKIILFAGIMLIISGIYVFPLKTFFNDYTNFLRGLRMQGFRIVSIFFGITLVYIGLNKR